MMDTNLLRSWLGLPPGPWPPGDRELLGTSDAAAAERRALSLMGALRPHQLRHPDLVTEGMNRIAQALLAVSAFGPASPPAPAAPPPAPVAKTVAPPPVAVPVELAPPKPATPTAPLPPPPTPKVMDAEVFEVAPEPPPLAPLPASRPAIPAATIPLAPDEPPIDLPVEDIPPTRTARREAYAELAALRALRRAWEKLGPFAGVPSESLPTPGPICEYLEAVDAVRVALRHPASPDGLLEQAAPLVEAVVRQPLALATFRALTREQRLNFARDWAVGRATLADQYEQLRDRLAASRPPKPFGHRAAEVANRLARNPEWSLVVGTLALAGLALLRSVF